MVIRPSLALAAFSIALLAACPGAKSSSPAPERPDLVFNGSVRAIAVASDGTAYLGGDFTAVGPFTGNLVVLDPASGSLASPAPLLGLPPWSSLSTAVFAAAPDGRGGWYVGGEFTMGPGAPLACVARVRSDGTVDPSFSTPCDGVVLALAVSDGTVYIGGTFDQVGGAARHRLAAVDAATGAVTPWDPAHDPSAIPALDPSLAYNRVYALAAGNGKVYAGGDSATGAPGSWSSWLAAIDPAGAVSAWSPAVDGWGVNALAVRAGTLFVGGNFSTIDGQPRGGLAAFDPDGLLSTWTIAGGNVRALAFDGGTLYAGGWSVVVDGQPCHGIAAFDPSGAASCRVPDIGGRVDALAASGGTLYVGGSFELAGGARRSNLAAFDASGALLPWSPLANDHVMALAVASGRVLAGGSFDSVGGDRRNRLAALDAGGRLTAWDPHVDGTSGEFPTVRALALDGGRVYVGGAFGTVGGAPRTNLAAVDLGGQVVAGTPPVSGPVHALATLGGAVYVGGDFREVGGISRASLAAFDPSAAGSVLAFDPALAGSQGARPVVRALAARGSTLYAGGSFFRAAGTLRGNGAAFDAAGALLPWDPAAVDPGPSLYTPGVYALAPSERGVYVGGRFETLGGHDRRAIGLVDAVTGSATEWNPSQWASGALLTVYALRPGHEAVYVGGEFSLFGGAYRCSVAALDAGTGAATGWNPGVFVSVHALGAHGDRVLIGHLSGLAAAAP